MEASAAANVEVTTPRKRVMASLSATPSKASRSPPVVHRAPREIPDPEALAETGAAQGRVDAPVSVVLEGQASLRAAVGAEADPAVEGAPPMEAVAAPAEGVAAPAEGVAAPAEGVAAPAGRCRL